jgi:lantibiotic modifying enzyme
LEGLRYERTVFDATAGNWPDFSQAKSSFANRWCHGATGIGLSRLSWSDPSADAREDIERAVSLTLKEGLPDVDHLCCGNAGQLSFLFEAARRHRRVGWESAARERLIRTMTRARHRGSYTFFADLAPQAFSPTLMRGSAGIGYEWLRISRPQLNLPSLLLLE